VASRRVLLVEGRDDEHVVYALRDAHGIPKVFDVAAKQGRENLLDSIPVELKASDRERLAVILDADDDLESRSRIFLRSSFPRMIRSCREWMPFWKGFRKSIAVFRSPIAARRESIRGLQCSPSPASLSDRRLRTVISTPRVKRSSPSWLGCALPSWTDLETNQ
jgi:hypothetical protein